MAGWGVDRRRHLLGRAGLIFARWPDSVFLATTEAICGGHPVEAQYDALRQKLLLVALTLKAFYCGMRSMGMLH